MEWIKEERDIFRWAKSEDLDLIANIALKSFHWNISKNELIDLWSQKIDKNILAVVEQNGDVKGFVEILSNEYTWKIICCNNLLLKIRERVARFLLCNNKLSENGTYLLYIATKNEIETIGLGAKMINAFKKYNNSLSVLCLKSDSKIIRYYNELGFRQSRIPLNLLYRLIINRKYIYLSYKSKN
jgi:hypothetical protein